MGTDKKLANNLSEDIIEGFSSTHKHIPSKYFYDDEGSRLFQKIMDLPEYYLTNSEHEILTQQTAEICKEFNSEQEDFDLIELGAGDGAKTSTLIEYLLKQPAKFCFTPIDISSEALKILSEKFKIKFPDLNIEPKTGDYFKTLHTLNEHSEKKKVILFLGSTIGNYNEEQSLSFFKQLRESMHKDDLLFVGFDLHKKPSTILSAYSDSQGVTRDFNLNLLKRLNTELGADFDTSKFSHYASYDPIKKAARSFLISLEHQIINFSSLNKSFELKRWEPIFTEISRKHTLETIDSMASQSGFKVCKNFFDKKEYYATSLWKMD